MEGNIIKIRDIGHPLLYRYLMPLMSLRLFLMAFLTRDFISTVEVVYLNSYFYLFYSFYPSCDVLICAIILFI